jgi:hypothetical protein
MKFIFLLLTLLVTFNVYSAPVWKSAFTDLKNDCVAISSATDKAPIDFYRAECKSFAGFILFIDGGDLRYGPELHFKDSLIDLQRPPQFHDMGTEKIEWLYTIDLDDEGSGIIVWRGMIFQLSIANEDGVTEKIVNYSVRLDGDKSCLIGTTNTDTGARNLVYSSTEDCIAPSIK